MEPMKIPVQQHTVSASTYVLARKLAAWFGVPLKMLFDETSYLKQGEEWDSFLWHSPELKDRFGFGHIFRTMVASRVNLLTFLEIEKWEKSDFYTEFLAGENKCPPARRGGYMLGIQLKGQLWVARRSRTHYEGLGGIWVGKQTGYVIEPLKNFLAYNYPHSD